MTHSTYTAEERRAHLISDGLVRLSAGLEDPDDLLTDIEQALDCVARSTPAARAVGPVSA
jgi:methionine-gamma-lyase